REQLQRGQENLYKRLYAPQAFAERLLGNLSRFRDIRFRPERFKLSDLGVLGRLVHWYWRQGPAARKFFWGCLWKTLRTSPRLFGQMSPFLGMYMHVCKRRARALAGNPGPPGVHDPACPRKVQRGPQPRAEGPWPVTESAEQVASADGGRDRGC